ncbi:glycosyltransferase [Aeromicrobium sp. IC_218]|uniref:glycosyltransferase n=1 Tax=Aeromicrobium sp. IC_218 TaxID=2545468 RepID=UPI001040B551|nr:glycosyltransferase [Aeromicrobium sp. IC_218]TCI97822.1 glycosyltransferase [Aeromicrobium sp. IC_218]
METGPATAGRPRVSVIVPSYRGEAVVGRCLRSLAAQTLPDAEIEVVVVLNGPLDGSRREIDAVREEAPALRVRVLQNGRAGASRARNLGLAAATGEHVTFVDDDDWLAPSTLETLLSLAAPGVVPIAHVADVPVTADGRLGAPSYRNYIEDYLVAHEGRVVELEGRTTPVGFVAAKLAPVELARAARFDEDLRSGEDLVYWNELYAHAPFRLAVCSVESGATYFRALRPDSVSRRELTYDFAVTERLDVIERLAAARPVDPRAERLRAGLVSAQSGHARRYLTQNPQDVPRVGHDLRRRGLGDVVDRRLLQADVAQDLAILYAFAPYSDTSASVAGRRLLGHGVMVDVVSNALEGIRAVDTTAWMVVDDVVGRHAEVHSPVTAFHWPYLDAFCLRGMEVVERWVAEKGPYRTVYSRAMLPGSHVLAALVKLQWPETRWVAEFSDPMVWDSNGACRTNLVRPGRISRTLIQALRERGVQVPDEVDVLTVPEIVELLGYELADEVHFTNPRQQELMLGYLPDRALADRVAAKAEVHPHPTLPQEFYERVPTALGRIPGRVNLAYFGVFYATRGLGEVVAALEALTPEERSHVAVRVFTSDPAGVEAEMAERGLSDVVFARPYVPYLEFLNLTTQMDVLLVNDARTRGIYDVNPYLPSKWSDYRGSGSDVWAIVEPGSVLSTQEVAYRSELGDVDGAVRVLRSIVRDHALAPAAL